MELMVEAELWEEHEVEEDSEDGLGADGRCFYANSATGAQQWEKPEVLAEMERCAKILQDSAPLGLTRK
jgi:hypothetical protein|tara:strand:- start:5152 stop:5358 length:207 start_codon:yes stop_codon:yes gene_type:complete